MIAHGSILSGSVTLGSDPEVVGTFTDLFITYRALIWDKLVAIFQGSDVWTFLNPANDHFDGRMGYKLIYNHYMGSINIYNFETGGRRSFPSALTLGNIENGPLRSMLPFIRISIIFLRV